jgi:xanthine dehydrogenase accessory factor
MLELRTEGALMFDDFFAKGHELWQQGKPFATATVVRADKPTSGKPGDKAIITEDGEMFGWIGGSCAQPTVIEEAIKALAENRSYLIRLATEAQPGGDRGGITELPMTCYSGGTMEIYIEPHQPRVRIVVIGGQHVAQALVHLGRAMGYEIVSVVPAGEANQITEADQQVGDLEALPKLLTPGACVVVATHGNYDELALEPALKSGAGYVGLVASRKRAESVVEYLQGRGLSDKDLAALHVPAGLDIGARRGDEIALSILAEIVRHRRQIEAVEKPTVVANEVEAMPESAIDPICGMSVQIEGAAHTHEHEGTTYYFCCAGCKTRFATDPQTYLEAAQA